MGIIPPQDLKSDIEAIKDCVNDEVGQVVAVGLSKALVVSGQISEHLLQAQSVPGTAEAVDMVMKASGLASHLARFLKVAGERLNKGIKDD